MIQDALRIAGGGFFYFAILQLCDYASYYLLLPHCLQPAQFVSAVIAIPAIRKGISNLLHKLLSPFYEKPRTSYLAPHTAFRFAVVPRKPKPWRRFAVLPSCRDNFRYKLHNQIIMVFQKKSIILIILIRINEKIT